ncbi:ESX-1 secretion-associated protein EspL [Mycobacterium kubicae]|uniref:ESX-1 secretion-associated protein EspL n=2 Tax=Mycobacterium kubicae TaxID=120959 RepID=A0AAX1J9V4_9MYCO|nr:YbaB/EbfC family nucleoid-associated protein [Mycobacterium kubicae]MCV7094884.1 YbaB/EbfC family nucleoid-associated protein [Mycobacterium kubicae]QNI09149.1 YbaB/EbfC family nucleoid-associated protein [Mycobacterium kubicae]QNI14472.1 YbaB/EbfC family nucleoid-associated protein [Mycobacterium kubicae]QPI37997.1 YbaB/EbfC family nucleoid-associated protein [Mycobacterium kubicae]GFG65668.1 ESX-1 secretion-associated protein EspL [Mycobacterium kubicae]
MTSMEMPPHVAQALAVAAQFQSALDGTLNQMNTGSFRGTDEAQTVEVTINGHQWLTGVRIDDGLIKEIGAEAVGARVNEALAHAQSAASAYNAAAGEQLTAALAAMSQAANRGVV